MAFFETEYSSHRKSSKSIDNPQVIGEHIKKRRLELNLKQSDLAKILEVCDDTITGWERNKSKPTVGHFPKLISFLGYNPVPVEADTLGGRMKKYRIENGLSQEDLAKKVGVNESTIFSWEKDLHVPFPKKLKLLEEILKPKELSI